MSSHILRFACISGLFRDNQSFYMKITNSYNRPVLFHKNNYLTTKVEKDVHGYGLTNVKNIVKKYDGTIEFNHQNKIFVTKIYLYI